MTHLDINQSIAKHCDRGPIPHWHCHLGDPESWWHPDYCNDLNAMHEAEKHLISGPPGVWECYENRLKAWHGGTAIHATASERAEAFLRTIGKWRTNQ